MTRQLAEAEVEKRILLALDDVASLDHDRILRSYLTHIRATLRTNYFQPAAGTRTAARTATSRSSSSRPRSPTCPSRGRSTRSSCTRRGSRASTCASASVARGGLRWSDRRDDFRTEVLGLVKAQMVKNTVIVPVGAKGGFFCKQLPDPGDRDAWLAEGIACYTTFISGLLDITDNLVEGETVPPRGVVRHDGDDSYLVVAADKGTATFSDIANGVAQDYGFWLGDAFASGGSVGYDHKAMGITARGAWVSVQRHFRERGIDCQTEDFTGVGIGDMSGDVFGNGMLCSEHTRLVAAFDHRDIFLDPDPDPATSYAERKRLFELPRSSWQDYDRVADLRGRRRLPALDEVDPAQRRGARGARHRRRRRRDDPGRADEGDPAGAGRPALERRHRHLRQGVGRDPRRRRRQGQRRDPGRRPATCAPSASARAATSGSPSSAGSSTPPRAAGSTPTSSTTRPASTPPTTRSTSRSCSTASSPTAT